MPILAQASHNSGYSSLQQSKPRVLMRPQTEGPPTPLSEHVANNTLQQTHVHARTRAGAQARSSSAPLVDEPQLEDEGGEDEGAMTPGDRERAAEHSIDVAVAAQCVCDALEVRRPVCVNVCIQACAMRCRLSALYNEVTHESTHTHALPPDPSCKSMYLQSDKLDAGPPMRVCACTCTLRRR